MNVKVVAPKPNARRWPLVAVLVTCVALSIGLLTAAHPDLVDVSRGLGVAVLLLTAGWIVMVTRDLDAGRAALPVHRERTIP